MKCVGAVFGVNFPLVNFDEGGIFTRGMSGVVRGTCLDPHAGLRVVRVAAMICATLVNTQTDSLRLVVY